MADFLEEQYSTTAKSMAKIAAELNEKFKTNASRNAVIGKINRLGMREKYPTARFVRVARNGGASKAERATVRRFTKVAASAQHQEVKYSGPSTIRLPVVKEPPKFNAEAVMASGPVDIHGLTSTTCHWPLGGVNDRPPYMFCGAIVSHGSYCAHHNRIKLRKQSEQ